MRLPIVLLAVALLGAAPADWSRVTTRNPDGSLTVGNPKARIRVTEYVSLTCSHCAQVAREADAPLRRDWIAPGRVAFTVQHAVRDRYDLAATMLARCTAPGGYWASLARLFAAQDDWLYVATRAEGTGDLIGQANAAGLPGYLAPPLPPARVAACLNNAAEQGVLARMAARIWGRPGFPGTPVFEVNGRTLAAVRGWAELEAAIKAAK